MAMTILPTIAGLSSPSDRGLASADALTPGRGVSIGRDMDFELTEDQRAFQATARQFARDEMMPNARDWDENETFPVETLRKAAALGFGGIYVKDDVGGSALTRLDATIIFEELAQGCTSTAAYISIHNMAAWMIDAFGGEAQRQKLPAEALHHGAFRELLPDRAGLRLGRREPEDHARCATATITCSTASKAFISGGGVSDIYVCMVRTGGAGPKGISCIVVEKGTPGLSYRRAGEEARLEIAADRDGELRELPRAGGKPDRPGGRRLQDRDGGARRRAAQHRGLLDRRRAVLPRPHHRIHARAKAVRLAARRISRRCAFASPTTRPSSRPRG